MATTLNLILIDAALKLAGGLIAGCFVGALWACMYSATGRRW